MHSQVDVFLAAMRRRLEEAEANGGFVTISFSELDTLIRLAENAQQ